MNQEFAFPIDLVLGLAFDVERSESKSGFKPARFQFSGDKELFGDIRLDGFAALLRLNFAQHLIIIGGEESRYCGEASPVNRAWAIREMLVRDLHIDPNRVSSIASGTNTIDNVATIRAKMDQGLITCGKIAIVSSHYHLPRLAVDLLAAGLSLPIYPAEAFLLIDNDDTHQKLVMRFGEGPLAERVVEEIQGIAHKLYGVYKTRVFEGQL